MRVSIAAFALLSFIHGVESQASCPYDPMNDPMGMMEWLSNNCRADQASTMLGNPCCFITPPLTRITATQAFDAYQSQSIDGNHGVLMIDVRAPDELYWTGQPSQVTEINLKARNENAPVPDPIEPQNYKAVLEVVTPGGKEKEIEVRRNLKGRNMKAVENSGAAYANLVLGDGMESVLVEDIEKVDMEPIAYNVPVETRNDEFKKVLNPNFGQEIMELIMSMGQNTPRAIVFYCRSGKRSSVGCYFGYCYQFMEIPQGAFTFYEVEAVDEDGNELNGNGGFEGSSYGNKYNGYRGFPGRPGVPEAVDFKDAGLPIIIGQKPLKAGVTKAAVPWACKESASADTLAACQ